MFFTTTNHNQPQPMQNTIVKPRGRRVVKMREALRKLNLFDAIVMPRPHRAWKAIYKEARRVGIEITASAPHDEPAIIVRIS